MNKPCGSFSAALLAACVLAVPGPARGQEQTPVAGIITYAKGNVTLTRYGTDKPVRAKASEFLNAGDMVKTGRGGQASIAFKEGAEVRLNEDTEFTVNRQETEKKGKVFLALGQVWTRMLHHRGGQGLSIGTPMAVASVRGTEADVEMQDMLTVKVYEGLVNLQNAFGTQSLNAGQMSQVSGAANAPAAPRQMTREEIGTWQNKIKIKNIEKVIEQLQAQGPGGEKKLKIEVEKDGKTQEIELKFRKK